MRIQRCGHRLTLLTILLAGLGSTDSPRKSEPSDGKTAPKAAEEPPVRSRRLEMPGIDNLFELTPGLYSGAQPEGEAGFESLRRLGVKTIVSVDGARPDLEAARRLGIRYVHLPFGYDGVPQDQAARLVKTARDLPRPLFVHCHHGKHRGPTAAALCALATVDWEHRQARAWLTLAGTDPKYRGLYAAVDDFAPPSPQELNRLGQGDLPERAEVPSLVETMVQIDGRWDRLAAAQKTGFRPAPGRDLDPAREATLLAEHFREAARHDESPRRGEPFNRIMADAGRNADALEAALLDLTSRTGARADLTQSAEAAFARLRQDCTTCHTRYRDAPSNR